MIHFGETAIY